MCAAILDNVFGIDRPTAPAPQQPIAPLPPSIANPNAGSAQADITPTSDSSSASSKRRGTSSLRIDRAPGAGVGLNIPQA
jgi:hypothetical protein